MSILTSLCSSHCTLLSTHHTLVLFSFSPPKHLVIRYIVSLTIFLAIVFLFYIPTITMLNRLQKLTQWIIIACFIFYFRLIRWCLIKGWIFWSLGFRILLVVSIIWWRWRFIPWVLWMFWPKLFLSSLHWFFSWTALPLLPTPFQSVVGNAFVKFFGWLRVSFISFDH